MLLRSLLIASQAVLLLLISSTGVQSLAPPHPNYEDWESVHAMRRRLNIDYHYDPVHLSHEHCRYLTEEKCREEDEGLGHAKAGRHGRHLNPSVGLFRVLVVLLRFSDHVTRELPTREYFDEMFNGDGTSAVNVVGSVKEYMRFNSLGKYRVQFDVRDWHTAPNTEAYYSQGMYGLLGTVKIQEMFYTAMDAIDASGINWQDGYVNGWGMLNQLVVVHSGFNADLGPFPCLANEPPQNRIWSQGAASSPSGWTSKDFYQVNGFAISSAFSVPKCTGGNVTAEWAGMSVLCHEYLHGFGLIDMYDTDKNATRIAIGGLGRFDIMANAWGWTHNMSIPGDPSAYSRQNITGWLDPILIVQDGFYAIQPAEISAHVYKISHNFPEGEYMLIESRQPIKWEQNWPAGGIVIYHVDEKAPKQTERGYPGMAGWPAAHYMVSIIQADGKYEIEKGINLGDVGDLWIKGNILGPGPNFPNTDSIQGGVQNATGITITVLSDPGFIMTFQVEGISGNGTTRVAPSTKSGEMGLLDPAQQDPDTTGSVLSWILSMLGGIAAMLGIMVVML